MSQPNTMNAAPCGDENTTPSGLPTTCTTIVVDMISTPRKIRARKCSGEAPDSTVRSTLDSVENVEGEETRFGSIVPI